MGVKNNTLIYKNMGFGIIRARNLSAGAISRTDKHNARWYSSEKEYPENIKIKGKNDTKYQTEQHEDYLLKNEITLQEALDIRLKENNVKGIRKNSNLAIEDVCTINDKKAWERCFFSGFVSNTQTWLEDRQGKNSIIATYSHLDESNPHVHFVVAPLVTKQVKWKNKKGQGVRTETRLNTREHTGGRKKLSKLQDDYYSHLIQRYGAGENNELGVPLYRGTLASEQFIAYSQQTDHEIGALRNQLENINSEVLQREKEFKIIRKQAEFKERQRTFESQNKKRNEYNRKNWQNKGVKDNLTIFHTQEKKETKNKDIERSI